MFIDFQLFGRKGHRKFESTNLLWFLYIIILSTDTIKLEKEKNKGGSKTVKYDAVNCFNFLNGIQHTIEYT